MGEDVYRITYRMSQNIVIEQAGTSPVGALQEAMPELREIADGADLSFVKLEKVDSK